LTEDLSDVAMISERRITGVAGFSSKRSILIVVMLFRRVEVVLLWCSDRGQAELLVR
jgi:hypothetical protein